MAYSYENGAMTCDGVGLEAIAGEAGTPCYVYSAADILERYRAYDEAFGDLPHRVCYAVKANSNLSVLRLLAQAGAGFDIVSVGELYRVLQAGGDASRDVFSGVGKTEDEIAYALREDSISSTASRSGVGGHRRRCGRAGSVLASLSGESDVDAATHPYISTGMSEHKFGIDIGEVEGV
jgi:diaminopimelate decarboxylase